MNDYIEINNLIIFANHGVFDEEETMGQRFMLSLKLYTNLAVPARDDDIAKSINYGEVCEFVSDYTKKNRSKLIETAAENIAYELLLKYDSLKKVEVKFKKPWAPIGLPLDDVLVNLTREKNVVYLSIGSNIGDRKRYIDFAVGEIDKHKLCRVRKVSSYIETEPVGGVEQEDFLNACVELETMLPPYELLAFLNKIENDAGRKREIHWGPRTLDIDIVLFGNMEIAEEKLTIPHREMHKRRFVLQPLCEIAPYAYNPRKRAFATELLAELGDGKESGNGSSELL